MIGQDRRSNVTGEKAHCCRYDSKALPSGQAHGENIMRLEKYFIKCITKFSIKVKCWSSDDILQFYIIVCQRIRNGPQLGSVYIALHQILCLLSSINYKVLIQPIRQTTARNYLLSAHIKRRLMPQIQSRWTRQR